MGLTTQWIATHDMNAIERSFGALQVGPLAEAWGLPTITGMSNVTKELVDICERLPEAQRVEVADFARFLLARNEDAAWEQTLTDGKQRPRLEEFLKASKAEGSDPMSLERL